MSNGFDKLVGGIGKAIETVPSIYEDVFKPAAQESGKILSIIPQTVNAALIPLRKWNIEREYNFQEVEKLLAQKLKHVNPEKIVTPDAYVAVPAIQSISYSMDSDELRNLYANLLAKAMNKDTKDIIHPAYLETIKQLSPDDATYFKYICTLDSRPLISVNLELPNSITKTISENSNIFSAGHVKNYGLSVDNLSRLGLIAIPNGVAYGDNSIYKPLLKILKEEFTLEKYKSMYPDAIGFYYDKRRIDITIYGKNFYDICII